MHVLPDILSFSFEFIQTSIIPLNVCTNIHFVYAVDKYVSFYICIAEFSGVIICLNQFCRRCYIYLAYNKLYLRNNNIFCRV